MWFKNGLKAQKLLAQGSALGIIAISKAPCKGKSFINPWFLKLLPLLLYLHLEKRRGENLYICKLLLTLQKIR